MSEPVYVSKCRIQKVAGVTRRGLLADGTEVTFGVHGPIKANYGLEAEPDHPLPVDFLVAAACA